MGTEASPKHCYDAGPSYCICCVPAAQHPGDLDFSRSNGDGEGENDYKDFLEKKEIDMTYL